MAQRHNTDPEASLVPVLLHPSREDLVNGDAVTFEWEPVPQAREQRLQVATSPAFEAFVLERDVTGESRVTVEEAFQTLGDTFFWRVLVTDEAGRTHGYDQVETFVASPEAVEGDTRHTGHEEAYGPVGELLEGVTTEATAEVTHDGGLFQKEVEMGVAHEGIAAGQIIGLSMAILLAIALAIVTLFQLTQLTEQEVRYSVVGASNYPVRTQMEEEQRQILGSYGVVDEESGTYRIPIDRAIELMIQEAGGSQAQGLTPETQALPAQSAPAAETGPETGPETGTEAAPPAE